MGRHVSHCLFYRDPALDLGDRHSKLRLQVGEHIEGTSSTPDSPKSTNPRILYVNAIIPDPWGTVLMKCVGGPAGQHEVGAFCIGE